MQVADNPTINFLSTDPQSISLSLSTVQFKYIQLLSCKHAQDAYIASIVCIAVWLCYTA